LDKLFAIIVAARPARKRLAALDANA